MPSLIVTCYAMFWLILMGGLLFSEGKMEELWIRGEEGGEGETGKSEGRGK